MLNQDSFMQIRAALDSSTETLGGDQRTGVGAVFIQKEIDRMIRETINRDTDFRQLVTRGTMNQKAKIWNLKTSLGATAKTTVYSDGGTGTPQPNRYMQLIAPAISYRSDYEVTNFTIATASSYFNAMDVEARDALTALALTEEQMFILGNDASAESTGITINGQVGVTDSFPGLKQILSSAVAVGSGSTGGFADASTIYGLTRSSTSTDRQFKLNVKTVNTVANSQTPLSRKNLNSAITVSNKAGGKNRRRMFLCSEERLDEVEALIAPQGRFVIGASSVELDGGLRVLVWRGHKIIASRLMAFNGVTSDNGSSVSFVDTDNCVLFLNMDEIRFTSVAGVDTRHVPVFGDAADQRADVQGGFFKTYGVFTVDEFTTQVVIWNLATPPS